MLLCMAATPVLAEPPVPAGPQKPEVKPKEKSVEERVRAIIVEQLGVKPEQVTLKARLREDLGADSLDAVEMVLAFEEQFSVSIPDADAGKMATVGDVVRFLQKPVKKQ